jgi:hypothetical protein
MSHSTLKLIVGLGLIIPSILYMIAFLLYKRVTQYINYKIWPFTLTTSWLVGIQALAGVYELRELQLYGMLAILLALYYIACLTSQNVRGSFFPIALIFSVFTGACIGMETILSAWPFAALMFIFSGLEYWTKTRINKIYEEINSDKIAVMREIQQCLSEESFALHHREIDIIEKEHRLTTWETSLKLREHHLQEQIQKNKFTGHE